MGEYLGKLHETVVKFPNTDIWMDSCGEAELDYGLERGIVGATSNPVIIGQVIKDELPIWEGRIKHYIAEMPTATEEEIAWEVVHECTRERAKKLLPVFEATNGKKGRLSAQTNAKFYRSPEKMVEQAVYLSSLGDNIQIKMPTSEAGIKAFEEVTYQGVNINATVSFTVAQAVAVAEAVERGLKRREAEGLSTEDMTPICTIMIGRTDDWVKESVKGIAVDHPDALEWAGVAVMKEAYRIFNERGYRTRLLTAAYRNVYHWSEFIGGDISMTIPFGWHKKINACDVEVVSRIDNPIPEEFMNTLKKLPEFIKAFDEKALPVEEFVNFGAFRKTINGFISGYEDLLKLVRSYMV
ncbi:transaldolase family protein [Anaerosacchariphilus polymeriproducens]|uniref:Transaldolase n=1 Tax=Anaerosacchariphilus polymeriproducens TaxID=1812858 RepID=A0A371AWJ5_9FIRM|nr:transaldolase family protein [Anaerosacchariphilus polymeriproducens]RDU23955.1 transaldolase [Anaerosacchariphilus polymeriproducens]